MAEVDTITNVPTTTALIVVATEPDYICPVCHVPVYPGDDSHEEHIAEWCQGRPL